VGLRIKPEDVEDSILIYCAQSDTGQGDFTSLSIKDKHLEYMFDAGSGPAVLRSEREVKVGEWINVTLSRQLRDGMLKINDEEVASGRSPGTARGLNLLTPFYIGGTDRERIKLSNAVGVNRGFKGCVSDVRILPFIALFEYS
jgi:dystroglycan 1